MELKLPQQLWVLAHEGEGVVFALGNSAHNAWANAIAVLYGELGMDAVRYDQHRSYLRRRGWKAVKVRLEQI